MLALLDRAPLLDQKDADIHLLRSKALQELDRYDDAIMSVRRAIDLRPDGYVARHTLCWNPILSHQPREARHACEKSFNLSPINWPAALNIGSTYLLDGNRSDAWVWFERALLQISNNQELREGPLEDMLIFQRRGWQAALAKEAYDWFAAHGASQIASVVAVDPESIKEVYSSYESGLNLRREGQACAALPYAERSLALAENAFGPQHPVTSSAISLLAGIFKDIGLYAAAEPLYVRALAIDERTLGPDNPNTGATLSNLGDLYGLMGQYAKGEPLIIRALLNVEKAFGPDHPRTGIYLSNVAVIYRALGQYAKAEPLNLRAVEIAERSQGPQPPTQAQGSMHWRSIT